MTRRQTASIVFVVLCIILVAAAVTLNIGWIMVNGRRLAPLVLGVSTFTLIIAGLIFVSVSSGLAYAFDPDDAVPASAQPAVEEPAPEQPPADAPTPAP